MKTLRLYAATLLAIKEHAEDGEPFSARDITEYIAGKLEDGEWELQVNNSLKHDTVRSYVHEIMDNKLLELSEGNYSYTKDYPRNSSGDSYKRYYAVFESFRSDSEVDEEVDDFEAEENDLSGDYPTDPFEDTEGSCCDKTLPECEGNPDCGCESDGQETVCIVVADGSVSIVIANGSVSMTVG